MFRRLRWVWHWLTDDIVSHGHHEGAPCNTFCKTQREIHAENRALKEANRDRLR